MKVKITLIALAALSVARVMYGQDVKKVILEDETATWQVWVGDRVNIPAAQKFMAPDFIDIDASGAMWSASEMFQQMKDCGISSFKIQDSQIKLPGIKCALLGLDGREVAMDDADVRQQLDGPAALLAAIGKMLAHQDKSAVQKFDWR